MPWCPSRALAPCLALPGRCGGVPLKSLSASHLAALADSASCPSIASLAQTRLALHTCLCELSFEM